MASGMMRMSKLQRFILLAPFWALMFLLISVLLHRQIVWIDTLIFALIIGALYTFFPPTWWREKFKRPFSQ